MKYHIINRKEIGSDILLQMLEEILDKQSEKLDRYVANYSKSVELTVHVSRTAKQHYVLAYSINMKNNRVYCSSKGPDLGQLAGELFDKVVRCLKKYRERERKEHITRKKLFREQPVEELIAYLDTHKKADKKTN